MIRCRYTIFKLLLSAFRSLSATGLRPALRSFYNGLLSRLFALYLRISPSTRSKMASEIAKARLDIQDKVAPANEDRVAKVAALPVEPKSLDWIKQELDAREELGDDWREGKISGAVYLGEPDHHPANEAMRLAVDKFMLSNRVSLFLLRLQVP